MAGVATDAGRADRGARDDRWYLRGRGRRGRRPVYAGVRVLSCGWRSGIVPGPVDALMTAFTRLGSSIWDWEPWTELGTCARVLWLALFTSAEAKRHVPGLWQGGIPMMADAAHMSADDVRLALDQLLERETVEFDARSRVLRLCHLPDAGEFPSNGKVILGWWTRFKTVPACPVRDAHVRTLQWILDTGAERRGTPLTPDHANAWRTTF